MKVSENVADFVYNFRAKDLPRIALERLKESIMDYVASTIAGVDEESARLVRQFVLTLGGNKQASVWCTDIKSSVVLAALANGDAAHAHDFDDINLVMLAHPSIQVLPGIFAIGEFQRCTGSEIITAYAVAFEVGAKLGRALNPEHVSQGWLPIGTLGTVMQAIASAKILGLNAPQMQMAMGLAANLACGLRCNNGTMAKHLLSGHVSCNGITAAMLAREGMVANPLALEDEFGFFENFSRKEGSSLEKAISSLGDPLEILESGFNHKPYPACGGTQTGIDCALEIARNHSPDFRNIKKIEATASSVQRTLLIHPRPQTPAEAKFSLEYCVCRALLDGHMGLEQFRPEKVLDPMVQALIEKVDTKYKDDFAGIKTGRGTALPAEVHVHMNDGKVYSSQRIYARGTQENPMSLLDLEGKFEQCSARKLADSQIERAKEMLRNFQDLKDVGDLVSVFREV